MKTKNISVNIGRGNKVPSKETYLVFYKSKNKVKIEQKFIDPTKNHTIILNYKECKRLMNLFNEFLFDGNFTPEKGRMEVFHEI